MSDHTFDIQLHVTVPPWLLATAAHQLAQRHRHADDSTLYDGDLTYRNAWDALADHVSLKEEFLTPTGNDAREAVLAAAEALLAEWSADLEE